MSIPIQCEGVCVRADTVASEKYGGLVHTSRKVYSGPYLGLTWAPTITSPEIGAGWDSNRPAAISMV